MIHINDFWGRSYLPLIYGFPHGSNSKEYICNTRDLGSIPGSGKSPGEGNGNPFQYSCLENSMDREAWQATVPGITKNWTWLSDFLFSFVFCWSACWNILPTFLRLLSSYKWVVKVPCYYVYKSFDEYMSHKYFLSVCVLTSHFIFGVIWRENIYNFNLIQFINFFF